MSKEMKRREKKTKGAGFVSAGLGILVNKSSTDHLSGRPPLSQSVQKGLVHILYLTFSLRWPERTTFLVFEKDMTVVSGRPTLSNPPLNSMVGLEPP